MNDAHEPEPYRPEQHAKIYLRFEDDRWQLDPLTCDDHALDGLDDVDPDGNYDGDATREEIAEVEKQADLTDLPTAREVLQMLADWYGYQLYAGGRLIRVNTVPA